MALTAGMTHLEMDAFEDPDPTTFDPVVWLNEAALGQGFRGVVRQGGAGGWEEEVRTCADADKFFTELSLKLQILGQEAEVGAEEAVVDGLKRMPKASRAMERAREDAAELRVGVEECARELGKLNASASEDVRLLSELDAVKVRMEEALSALRELRRLRENQTRLPALFAGDDPQTVGFVLSEMRTSLGALRNLPQFTDATRQLVASEDRLEKMVRPLLTDALDSRDAETTRKLRGVMESIGRDAALASVYSLAREKPLMAFWNKFQGEAESTSGGGVASSSSSGALSGAAAEVLRFAHARSDDFASWLPSFYDEVLLTVEQEKRWCALVFAEDPDRGKALIPQLLTDVFGAIASSFSRRFEAHVDRCSGGASGTGAPVRSVTAFLEVMRVHSAACTFARSLEQSFSDFGGMHGVSSVHPVDALIRAAFLPFEPFKIAYGNLERGFLEEEAKRILPVTLDRTSAAKSTSTEPLSLGECIVKLQDDLSGALSPAEAAVERCIQFTGAVEAEGLLRALEEYVTSILGRTETILSGWSKWVNTGGDGAAVASALSVLAIPQSIANRLVVFESGVRSKLLPTLNGLAPSVLMIGAAAAVLSGGSSSIAAIPEGRPPARPHLVRLRNLPADRKRRLAMVVQMARDARHILPRLQQAVDQFRDSVDMFVLDTLTGPIRLKLQGFSTLPQWAAGKAATKHDLPAFSAYPTEGVTAIGEFLLNMPQLLDPSLGATAESTSGEISQDMGGENEADDGLLAEWIPRVAEHAARSFFGELSKIPRLSLEGRQQLLSDVEYLINILNALSATVPAELVERRNQLQSEIVVQNG